MKSFSLLIHLGTRKGKSLKIVHRGADVTDTIAVNGCLSSRLFVFRPFHTIEKGFLFYYRNNETDL